MSYADKMREEAKSLLSDCRFVFGYSRGTFPYLDRMVKITEPGQVDDLYFGPTSIPNLTLYVVEEFRKPLKRGQEPDTRPVGVVCKGCDAKTVVELVREHIFPRDMVKVIGMPCNGVIDPKKLEWAYGEVNDVKEITWGGDGFLVDGAAPKEDLLANKCLRCDVRNPSVTDVSGMEEVVQPEPAGYEEIEAVEGMDLDARWGLFKTHFENCIRCYACKNVCPLCYCSECFVEKAKPYRWTEKYSELPDNAFYHIIRAIHLAGRCIDCGECERVCPVNVPLRMFNRKMEKVSKDNFEIEPGKDPDRKSLLGGCSFDEKEDFIW